MSAIPTKAREVVRERQDGCCARCANTYTDLHHRLRRREGGHGVEILVGLCRTCHSWSHANPARAREDGYIISVHEKDPASIPIKTYMGWVRFTKEGTIQWM